MNKTALPVALLLLLFLFSCTGQEAEKPNFLVLISDDQRWDQISYSETVLIPELHTPNMDRLAEQGVYFRNAFVTTPICAVSRASIMTGRYASSHGMNHFNTPLQPEVILKTYPALLRENGYQTGLLGKWGMGMEGTEKVFDVLEAWHHQGVYFHETDSGLIHNSMWLASKARDFFQTRDKDVPFCLTVCFKSPHHPYQPDHRDQTLFEAVQIPKRASDTEADYQSMAAHVMDSSLNRWCYFDERANEAIKDDFEKNFLRCVVSLDRGIGEIMQHLEDFGLHKNTVTLFLSDNGYLWGEHGLGGKWLLYEESIRIPIMIHDPRLKPKNKGTRSNQLVLNTDIAPTILDLAGLSRPEEMDGISLAPLLQNPAHPTRRHFFMEHVGVIEVSHPIPDSRGVRTENWKYIRYVHVDPEVEELYDLRQDPMERKNLAEDPGYQDTLKAMKIHYVQYLRQYQRNDE